MESKVKVLGHPVHPMLIPFPLGLLGTAVVFDLIHLLFDFDGLARAAYYMIAAGIIGGLIAAVPGLIDWLAIPKGTRAHAIGLQHLIVNDTVLILFAISWFIRRDDVTDPGALAYILSFAGSGLATLGGWLGGELVDRMGVAVDRGAHLNSPSSLSGRPASEGARDVVGQTGQAAD